MFTRNTFKFLSELGANNNRAWFDENKPRYEALVREPALDFIDAMVLPLKKFAPHFRADARKIGGSLMRVYRDTRFANDKTPYKTNIGIQFRHELARDVHAPGFYVHIANDECFFAAGCWRPEADALWKMRNAIAQNPEQWFKARDDKKFNTHWALDGDVLTRPPRGFAADHVAIDDLKRKDYVAVAPLSKEEVLSPDFVKLTAQRFTEAVPLMRFLCKALEVQY
ncbi:MAG: DUF2461 domain-containing protein [Proteobacteria bacterium]|nr:DUF2461 domain-containing protein [Pseudomonadota bacterium]MCL2307661.1 DUF2461 domain-containing protein [Pseudomonadota bacterium]